MKLKRLKLLGLALILPFLAGCDFIDNIIGKIVLDMAFETDFIMNKLDVQSQSRVELSEMPLSAEKRLSLTYGIELLAFPRDIEIEEFKDYPINFTYNFSDNARDLFFEAVEAPEATEEMSASVTAFYPLGTLDKPEAGTDLRELKNFLEPASFINLSKEADVNFSVEVVGKVKKTTKSVKYFFKLTADGLPEFDIDIEDIHEDHALGFNKTGGTKTKEYTLSAASLAEGVTIPLQVAWVNADDFTATDTGEITITTNDLTGYQVTEPAENVYEVQMNRTVVTHEVTIKKVGATEPLNLVFTIKLTVNS